MSAKHPIIAVTGSSGAGTSTSTNAFRSTGRQGVHTEHMGYLLAEMQHLQRAYPGGVW